MKQKYFFLKKKFQNFKGMKKNPKRRTQKSFSKSPILNIFCEKKFGLVELIDMKGIDVAQSMKFSQKILRIGNFEKLSFFESAILELFFAFIPMKISQTYLAIKDGSKFQGLPWFSAKNHSTQTFQPPVYISSYFLLQRQRCKQKRPLLTDEWNSRKQWICTTRSIQNHESIPFFV